MNQANDPYPDISRLWTMLQKQDALTQEMRNLLVRLETKLEHVTSALESISAPTGLPRCAERGERLGNLERRLEEAVQLPGAAGACVEQREQLEHLEEKFNDLCSRLWWFGTTVTATLIGLALRAGWEMIAS